MLALLAACEAPAAGPPARTLPAFEAARERFSGAVAETLAAGVYTYARLQLDGGDERWVVVSGRKHRDARRLTVDCHGRRRDFASPRLGREFSLLYFCALAEPPTT